MIQKLRSRALLKYVFSLTFNSHAWIRTDNSKQLFYNIPRCDPLTQSTLSFSHVNEQTKDANGVAWHTGSGYVLRLEALKHIGGWPIASLNEDTLTSTLLLGHGWKTAYIHESLVCKFLFAFLFLLLLFQVAITNITSS